LSYYINDTGFRSSEETNGKKFIVWLRDGLQQKGINSFLAEEDLQAGQVWDQTLNEKIRQCSVFIPVISPGYNESRW